MFFGVRKKITRSFFYCNIWDAQFFSDFYNLNNSIYMSMKNEEYMFYHFYKQHILHSEVIAKDYLIEAYELLHKPSYCPRCLSKMGDLIDDDFIRINKEYGMEHSVPYEKEKSDIFVNVEYDNSVLLEVEKFWKENNIRSNEEFFRNEKIKNIVKLWKELEKLSDLCGI